MKLNKILGICAGVLIGFIGLQIVILWQQAPRKTAHAIWAHNPESLAEGQKLSKQIVSGRVIKVERGEDIVVKVPGEPGGVDAIPVEIVTLALTGIYKGEVVQTVRVFHTGISRLSTKGIKKTLKPKDGKHGGLPIPTKRPSKLSASQVSSFSLDDDPPYKVGQKYIIFLQDGPTVGDRTGKQVRTLTMVNPSLRFQVLPGNKLRPAATTMDFSKQLDGKPLTELTAELPKFNPLPFNKQALQLQRFRLDELKKANKRQEFNRLLKQLSPERQQQLKIQ